MKNLITKQSLILVLILTTVFSAFSQSKVEILSFEAEDYNETGQASGFTWEIVGDTVMGDMSNDMAVQALPNDGSTIIGSDYTTLAPSLKYNVTFSNPGTYYFYARANSLGAYESNSFHAGISDGTDTTTFTRVDIDGGNADWQWVNQENGAGAVTYTVTTPGAHELFIWMREPGVMLDYIILTDSAGYAPQITPSDVPGTNLVYNPGYDEDSITHGAWGAELEIVDDPDDPTNRVLQIEVNDPSSAGLWPKSTWEELQVTAGKFYYYEVKIKADADRQMELRLQNPGDGDDVVFKEIDLTTEWTVFSGLAEAVNDDELNMSCFVEGSSETIYWDDMVIMEVTPPNFDTNVVKNYSFEHISGDTNRYMIDDWTIDVIVGEDSLVWSKDVSDVADQEATHGDRHIEFYEAGTANFASFLHQTINFIPEGYYTLSANTLKRPDDAFVDASIKAIGYGGDTLSVDVPTGSDKKDWSTVSIDSIYVTSGKIKIGAWCHADGDGWPYMFVDEVVFTAMESNDASLSALTLSTGTLTPAFDSEVFDYKVELPYGAATVPTVMATTSGDNATVSISDAANLPGTTMVTVTAHNGSTQDYTVEFTIADPSTDATLSELTITDGILDPAFNTDSTSYTVALDTGTTEAPIVAATANDENATVNITQANVIPGTAIITVTAQDNSVTKQYTINFEIATGVNDVVFGNVSVYPIPATEQLYITEIPGDVTELTLINLAGQVQFSIPVNNPNVVIPVSELHNGVYLMQLETKNGIAKSFKVVVR